MKHAAPRIKPDPLSSPDLSEHLRRFAKDSTEALVLARIEGGIGALNAAAGRVRVDAMFGAEADAVVAFLEEITAELAEAARRGRKS